MVAIFTSINRSMSWQQIEERTFMSGKGIEKMFERDPEGCA